MNIKANKLDRTLLTIFNNLRIKKLKEKIYCNLMIRDQDE